MLNPDHHTRRVLVADHQAELRRLAERAPGVAPHRRFTLTTLAGPQLQETRRGRFGRRLRLLRLV